MSTSRPNRAWKLLEQPGTWTQFRSARDAAGRLIGIRSHDACQWCALGAIGAVYPDDEIIALETRLRQQTPMGSIARWNDDPARTQSEVVALLKSLDI